MCVRKCVGLAGSHTRTGEGQWTFGFGLGAARWGYKVFMATASPPKPHMHTHTQTHSLWVHTVATWPNENQKEFPCPGPCGDFLMMRCNTEQYGTRSNWMDSTAVPSLWSSASTSRRHRACSKCNRPSLCVLWWMVRWPLPIYAP